MRVVAKHSHLNGEEWLIVHRQAEYQELLDVIRSLDAEKCRTKRSKEKRKNNALLYSPKNLNKEFEARLSALGWSQARYKYYVARDYSQYHVMLGMSLEQQKEYLKGEGCEAIYSYNQTDHVKRDIAVEVQFGKYSFVAYDLFVKHLAFYTGGQIEVGIEVLPMKSMQREMSSGIAYFEGEVYNILRHGRNNPPVPLLVLGIAPDNVASADNEDTEQRNIKE